MKPAGPSGAGIWVRVIVLLAALGGIIYSMSQLKKNPIGETLLNPPIPQEAAKTSGKLNLCPTRVSEIVLQNAERRARFFQKGLKWWVEGATSHELHPLFMEKWLGQYCTVKVDQFVSADEGSASIVDEMSFTYIDGTQKRVIKLSNGVFTTDGENVRSSELEAGHAQLGQN